MFPSTYKLTNAFVFVQAAKRLTSLRIHTINISRRLLSAVASSSLFVMQIRIGTLDEITLPATQYVVIAL
jgi:hypothetical protein